MTDELYRELHDDESYVDANISFEGAFGKSYYLIQDKQAEAKVAAWGKVRESTGASCATTKAELQGIAQRIHQFACNIESGFSSTAAHVLYAVAAALEEERKNW